MTRDTRHTSLATLHALHAAPTYTNPAVALWLEIQRLEAAGPLTVETLFGLRARIDAVTAASANEAQSVEEAGRRLDRAPAAPARAVPEGF